ncbi:MAG TPA: hypothetical protein VGL70_07560 [Candidatus Binatia bacterium]|jgi:hypothetical protein
MVAAKEQSRARSAEVTRAYARSELGREIIRREIVEGAQIKTGDQALLLWETAVADGIDEIVRVAAEIVRELGAKPIIMRLEEHIPLRRGTAPGAWSYLEKFQPAPAVVNAIRGADVVLDYTRNSRGAQKYNQVFYTLSMYYGKRICAHCAVEAPEVLSDDPEAPFASPEALSYPSELLRAIGRRVSEILIAAAEARDTFKLTNPWGTDLRFTALPGDVSQPFGGIRRYPAANSFDFAGDDNNRIWNALAGFAMTQACDGVWMAKHSTLLGGVLGKPVAVKFKDGLIVGADGGEEAKKLLDIIADEPSGVHAILMGLNPKAAPFRNGEYMLDNNGAGVGACHIALGGPGLFYRHGAWGAVGNKHFQLGNIPKISLWAGSRCVVEEGRLLALADPVIRKEAGRFGDAEKLLRQFDWSEAV